MLAEIEKQIENLSIEELKTLRVTVSAYIIEKEKNPNGRLQVASERTETRPMNREMQIRIDIMSDINAGTKDFLKKLHNAGHGVIVVALERLELTPEQLYHLYSGVCDRDLERVINVVTNCPSSVIKEASRHPDSYGKSVVHDYL